MNSHALLTALADRRIFIVYRLVQVVGAAKLDKVPTCPHTLISIDSQDSSKWLLPAEAAEHVEVLNLMPLPARVTGYGVGLVIQPGMFFLDLDSCRDPSGGWQPHALNFIERFPLAMREVSVSGTGLHVFGSYRGGRPLHGCKNAAYRAELYSGGRFAALGTSEAGDIRADCTEALGALIDQFFPRDGSEDAGEWRNTPMAAWSGPVNDDELIRRALRSLSPKAAVLGRATFKDLWEGNAAVLATSYPPNKPGAAWDGSSADFALFGHLGFWTGDDHSRILRLLARDDCMLRREKWGRLDDYIRPSILSACAGRTEWYKGAADAAPAPVVIDVPAETAPPPPAVAVAGAMPTPPSLGLQLLPATQAPWALTIGSKGRIEATRPNIEAVIGEFVETGFDTFCGEIMFTPRGTVNWQALKDHHVEQLCQALERGRQFASIPTGLMRGVLDTTARRNTYDSAQVWLNGLVWDGVPRIDNFLHSHCGAVDDKYTRAVSRYVWTGMPCRVFEPGCQVDMVVAFQSKQGTRKSSGLESLAPKPEWFTNNVSLLKDDDNFKRLVRSKLVIEIAELAGLPKAEVEHLKQMISRKFEEWVEKWEKFTTRYGRRFMLFASTNREQFLPEDETGQRRWLPVEIELLNDALIAQDCAQLWAEGAARWRERKNAGLPGVDYREAEDLARGRHAKHEIGDVWAGKIETWLETEISVEGGAPIIPAPCKRALQLSEVLEGACRMTTDKMNRASELRAAKVLRQLGYENKVMKEGKRTVKRWVLPKSNEVT